MPHRQRSMLMRRLALSSTVVVLGWCSVVGCAATGYAQQSLNFYVGGFVPRGEDARDRDDVLREQPRLPGLRHRATSTASRSAANGWSASASTSRPGSASAIYTQHRADRLRDFVNANGSEIEQDLKLRDRAVHRDGALPAARPQRRRPAVHRRRRRRLQLALQRDRRVRRLRRRHRSSATASSAAAPRPAR